MAHTESERGSKPTVVETIVAELCTAIFRGEYEPGTTLPPLRKLASSYDVTLPTIQRVLARLEELGIVRARQGSGVTVLEPRKHAEPSALPYWLAALRDQPSRASEVLAGFLEIRTQLAVHMILSLRSRLDTPEFEPVHEALEEFEEAARLPLRPDQAMLLDLAVVHRMLEVRGSVAFFTIFNVFDRLLVELPELQAAMYAQPRRNLSGFRTVFELLKSELSDRELREQLTLMITTFDSITLGKFEAILENEL